MNGHDGIHEMLARRSELPPQEEADLREHLATCPGCRQTAEDYAQQTMLLRSLPLAEPPPTLRSGVLTRIHGHEPAPKAGIRARPALLLAPLAAALVVVAALAYVHGNGGSRSAAGNSVIKDVPRPPAPLAPSRAGKSAAPLRRHAVTPSHRKEITKQHGATHSSHRSQPPASQQLAAAPAPNTSPTPQGLDSAAYAPLRTVPAGTQAAAAGSTRAAGSQPSGNSGRKSAGPTAKLPVAGAPLPPPATRVISAPRPSPSAAPPATTPPIAVPAAGASPTPAAGSAEAPVPSPVP